MNDLIDGIKEFGTTFVLPLVAVGAFGWLCIGVAYLLDPSIVRPV